MNMKKYALTIASFLLVLTGLARGMGGLGLLSEGAQVDMTRPITGSPHDIKVAAYSLLFVCLLLIVSGISLTIRRTRANWIAGWVSMFIFLIGGVINGFLLFGHPLGHDQLMNVGICILTGFFLVWGKERLIQNLCN